MCKLTYNEYSQLSIFRDRLTTLEQSQLNTSSEAMYPSIQHATILEDIILNELNEGSNESPPKGIEHESLYEHDRIDKILDSAFPCCNQLEDTDCDETTPAESHRNDSQVNCCQSPTPSPVSVTFQNPPALTKRKIEVDKDVTSSSFIPIPANHAPLRPQHHENGKSMISMSTSRDVMRLCKRQVISRVRISPRASRSWISFPMDASSSLPALDELPSTQIIDKMMSQLFVPLL